MRFTRTNELCTTTVLGTVGYNCKSWLSDGILQDIIGTTHMSTQSWHGFDHQVYDVFSSLFSLSYSGEFFNNMIMPTQIIRHGHKRKNHSRRKKNK